MAIPETIPNEEGYPDFQESYETGNDPRPARPGVTSSREITSETPGFEHLTPGQIKESQVEGF